MSFIIEGNVQIRLPKSLINDTVKELICGFLYRSVKVEYIPHDKNEIIIGEPSPLPLKAESVISVTEKGVYIAGNNDRNLLTALFILLFDAEPVNLKMGKEQINLPFLQKSIDTKIQRRMIHLCVFPKIPLSSYIKLVRIAGVLGFTHIVLEFWGTLKYDCLTELSWKDERFTKEEIALLIKEMCDLSIEPVPMFNHFSHASSSRLAMGKHVVLDQNPRLATMFSADGWWWRFDKTEVRALLKQIRAEQTELFGKGEFYHVGFDEGFSYPSDKAATNELCDYLKNLLEEVVSEGRTPLLWGDMFLHEKTLGIGKETGYEGNCSSKEAADKFINSLPKEAVVCDWQYFVKSSPWISAEYFRKNGVKTAICSWLDKDGLRSGIETTKELSAFAFMLTTWDKIFCDGSISGILQAYYSLYEIDRTAYKIGAGLNNATLLRKICFADGNYEKAGWRINDIDNRLSN